jgi:hypothetical protein
MKGSTYFIKIAQAYVGEKAHPNVKYAYSNVNLFLCIPWRNTANVEVQLHSFLTSALDGVSGQLHVKAALPPRKELPVPTEHGAG